MNKWHWKRWASWLLRLDYVLAVGSFLVLVAITFLGAFSRYFLHSPFIWLEEMQMALIVVFVFAGASAAARAGVDIALEVFVDALPTKARIPFEIFAIAATSAVLAYYIYNGIEYVQTLSSMARATNILKIPSALIYVFIPIGCFGILVNNIIRVRRDGLIRNEDYDD